MLSHSHLSLSELEAYDPHSPRHGVDRRFCCPLCGKSKPRDGMHRSLWANVSHGGWMCHRCGAKGKLTDFWVERSRSTSISRSQTEDAKFRRAFVLSKDEEPAPRHAEPQNARSHDGQDCEQRGNPSWGSHLRGVSRLSGTPGEAYLLRRGISRQLADSAKVRFAPAFYGRPAAVFPIRNQHHELVAVQGRFVDGRGESSPFHLKTQTMGQKKNGVFATPSALNGDSIVITESPIDALSLTSCGFPSIALCGKDGLPPWLPTACAYRTVYLGFDADEPGDLAAAKLHSIFASYGAPCYRLRPKGFKDWNEMLLGMQIAGLRGWLEKMIPIGNIPLR